MLDRGIPQLPIDRGIDASLVPQSATNRDPQQVAAIIQAHQAVGFHDGRGSGDAAPKPMS